MTATLDQITNLRALAIEEQRKADLLNSAADLLEQGYKSDEAHIAQKIAEGIAAKPTE